MKSVDAALQEAIQAAREGRRVEARNMLLEVVDTDPQNESAWIWLTGLVDDLEDKIIACENVLTINPSNERVRAYLNQLLERKKTVQDPAPVEEGQEPVRPKPTTRPPAPKAEQPAAGTDPWKLAKLFETEGKLEEAHKVLVDLAAVTRDSVVFDQIYKELSRIEALQEENITHISPTYTIARMTFGWPLLYLALALMQSGLNPIAHSSWFLWLGLPIVAVGGFLLAASEVRSRHSFWKKVLGEENEAGSDMARMSAAIGGWILVIMPHVLMLAEALNRLQALQIPPMPDL